MQYPTRWSMVLHFLRGSKRWFAAAIFSACVVSLLDLANPKIIGFTVDLHPVLAVRLCEGSRRN